MKKMVVLALLCVLATSAAAAVDPDPDMIGCYWDMNGDVVCQTAMPGFVNMYILYTNPTVSAVTGFEAQIGFQPGAGSLIFSTTFPTDFVNVGTNQNIIVGFGTPVPATPATLLATVQIYNLDPQLDVYLLPANPESPPANGLPKVVDQDYNVVLVGLSAADGPLAQLNAPNCGVVADEEASFGNVKALFR